MPPLSEVAKWCGRSLMSEDIAQQWHRVLSERNRLRDDLEALIQALGKHHDEHHRGPARWCDAEPCRLLIHLT